MLGIPKYTYGVVAENWMTGTPTTNVGTILGDPGATPNTKSATTALIGTGTSASAYLIEISISNTSATGVDTSGLLDIMYDPAGGTSWNVLIPNLLCGFRATNGATIASALPYVFPLYIPRGSSIGARWQTSVASPAVGQRPRVSVTLYGGPSAPGFWYGTKVTDYGTNTAASAGVDLNPGSTGTYSAWTAIGGTTTGNIGFLTLGVQGSAATHTADVYHIQYGFSSTQIPGAQVRLGYTTAEIMAQYPHHGGVYHDVPNGTQLQARATGSDATSEDPSVILYGVS